MSKFGWSLPAGCSTLPGEEPEPCQPRCPICKAFLPQKPERSALEEGKEPVFENEDLWNPDAKIVGYKTVAVTTRLFWHCKRCKKEVSFCL